MRETSAEPQDPTWPTSGSETISDSRPDHPDDPVDDAARLDDIDVEVTDPTTPLYIQDPRSWKRLAWVPYPVRRFSQAAVKWAKGPMNPRNYKIIPLFPAVQHAPLRVLDRFLPKRYYRTWLFLGFCAIWMVTFALVMGRGLPATEIEGWGNPASIGCGNTYWLPGNQCGLDGNDCRPFNNSGFAFRCPADCASHQVLNHRAVGDQEIIYRPLVIGGLVDGDTGSKPVYRGDSFICGAAIHAGIVSNTKGGCGIVSLVGKRQNFVNSSMHGIASVGFDSYFPRSFTFEMGVDCESTDMRWPLLAVSVVFTTVLSLFTTSPAVFFFTIFTGVFWLVGLATDPPNHPSILDLFTKILGRYLPAMFVAWVMYDKMGIRRTLDGLTAQIEKTILWLGACWVGALNNYTFSWIPIQRLTPHDLEQQPGARVALAIIIMILLTIAACQVWFFRQEGRLIRYLKLYLLFVTGIIVCLALPDLKLRIHHYILALLLLPGTSLQTRPSLLYQGLLVGLFINGIARWGWDPFLQTAFALRGDAVTDSPLPVLLQPVIALGANVSSITFRWQPPPGLRYDGISALVNDVERFRSYLNDYDGSDSFVWTRETGLGLNEYFRFAYMEGTRSWDYTRAGIWTKDGEWVEMPPGPSRIKSRSLDGEERL
jgi:hypothetical protein